MMDKDLNDERDRVNKRLDMAKCKGNDTYQEYIVSIVIKHKDSMFAHNLWFNYISSCLKAKLFKNVKVKSVQILKGLKRSPEMAASEEDWLEM